MQSPTQNHSDQLSTSTTKPKSVFCYCVYKTNSPKHQAARANHFKSSSAGPAMWPDPQVLYVNEKAVKSRRQRPVKKECSTQTSKTIIQLAKMEAGCMSPDSLTSSPREARAQIDTSMENFPNSVSNRQSSTYTMDERFPERDYVFNSAIPKHHYDLVSDYLRKKKYTSAFVEPLTDQHEITTNLRSKSFVESHYQHPNYINDGVSVKNERFVDLKPQHHLQSTSKTGSPRGLQGPVSLSTPIEPFRLNRKSSKSLMLPDNSKYKPSSIFYVPNGTYMSPTKASQIKSRRDAIESLNNLIPPVRGGRSTSPKPSGDQRRFESSRRIPYIDQSKSDVSSATTIVNTNRNPEFAKQGRVESKECETLENSEVCSEVNSQKGNTGTVDSTICGALNKFRDDDWQTALKGLAEIVELCRILDAEMMYEHMTAINQRLIETLKSPRSHVCRTACQAAGHLFEYVKDTRKPEFDDIVDLLLFKTADANKFIRHDANLALDCMVTHISTFNSVRALCAKGPFHKNNLVRCATVRLLVCATVIAGTDFILNPSNNDYTRKRIIVNMTRFLEDKNLETRKFAERLYKILAKDARFDWFLKQYLEKEQIMKIKKTLKLVQKK